MKRRAPRGRMFALISGLAGLPAFAASNQPTQPLPTPFPEVRYRQMSARSPFAVASPSSAATAAATPGFAAQLYVDGVAHIGTTDFVAIKSRDPDQQSVIFLEVGKSTTDGMKVERVQWSDEMGKSTVDVTKGGEKATLIFDEQQIAKAAPGPQAPATVAQNNDGETRFAEAAARRQSAQQRLAAYRLRQQQAMSH